ncbi:MAG: hypothetical protein ABIT96_07640 [Ferruginibacter sp.]
MKREVRIFSTVEEQEKYFLQHFYRLGYSERLLSLFDLQKKNYPGFTDLSPRKITIKKSTVNGYRAS